MEWTLKGISFNFRNARCRSRQSSEGLQIGVYSELSATETIAMDDARESRARRDAAFERVFQSLWYRLVCRSVPCIKRCSGSSSGPATRCTRWE